MYFNKINKGFTLIELIITVSILSILGTIAFISFSNYSMNSRDSVRITDLRSIEKSLELYFLKTGKYPKPNDSTGITFGVDLVWDQGVIGEDIVRKIGIINKKPIDPKFSRNYSYSLIRGKNEFQLGAVYESELLGLNNSLINSTYASDENEAYAFLIGTYNEKIVSIKSNSGYTLFATPSIVLSDIDSVTDLSTIGKSKVVIKGKRCFPHSYKGLGKKCLIDFTPQVVYTGKTLPSTENEFISFSKKLKDVYTNPVFTGEAGKTYENIKNLDTTNTGAMLKLGNNIVSEVILKKPKNINSLSLIDNNLQSSSSGGTANNSSSSGSTGTSSSSSSNSSTSGGTNTTGITILNISIIDPDNGSLSCKSCITFN